MSSMATFPLTKGEIDKNWWRGAVIYQIYPRSFQDSNGDGIGDLAGVVQRLPYVASLGVDAIWISPFFTSPMNDFGYDVSDYCDVDPMFGTLGDFDRLIERAHQLGIRVMIDLVLSHTAEAHPWFAQSRKDKTNNRSDWYVWADPKPDGTPPNNWLSIFGGSAWQWDTRREQYYLHNFLTSQPDLNFHTPQVQEALLGVARFWLDRGVDGFRLDTINFYTHDAKLRDNPALAPERRNADTAPAVNPYNYQEHIYSKNRPETLAFLRRLRAVMEPYGAAAVGEIGDAQRGLELLGEYTAGDDLVQMCYAFEFLSPAQPSAARIAEVMGHLDQVASNGWACWAFSNHDVMRHASRWHLPVPAQRLFISLIMCLRGSVCLYQGEELGLPEADVAYEDLQDPYGLEFWPEYKGRDGCRTPMVWEAGTVHAGFTTGKPWLPLSPQHTGLSVSAQEQDAQALLHHYRRAIALRQANPPLSRGDHTPVTATGEIIHFTRFDDTGEIFCAFNIGGGTARVALPGGTWEQIGAELGSAPLGAGEVELGPWQICLASRRSDVPLSARKGRR